MFALGKGKVFANAHMVTAISLLALDLSCVYFFPSLLAIAVITTATTFFCLMALMISTARILNTSLLGLLPWKSMLKILLASAFSCFLGSLAVSRVGITRDFPVLVMGFLVSVGIYLPVSRALGINYTVLLKPLVAFQKMNKIFFVVNVIARINKSNYEYFNSHAAFLSLQSHCFFSNQFVREIFSRGRLFGYGSDRR